MERVQETASDNNVIAAWLWKNDGFAMMEAKLYTFLIFPNFCRI